MTPVATFTIADLDDLHQQRVKTRGERDDLVAQLARTDRLLAQLDGAISVIDGRMAEQAAPPVPDDKEGYPREDA